MTLRPLAAGAVALLLVIPFTYGFAQWRSSRGNWIVENLREQGRLGVMVQDVTPELKSKKHLSVGQGAYISEVEENSPAEKAELHDGDVIVRFGGEPIDESNDLIKAVRKMKPKSEVKIEIVRKDEHKTITATIGREPRARAFSFNFGNRPLLRIPRLPGSLHVYSMNEFEGLQVEDLTQQLAEYFEVPGKKGVLVTEVEPGSAADKGGFKAGDVLIKAGGAALRRTDDLREEMSDRSESKLSIELLRKGKPLTLTLELGAGRGDEDEDDDDTSLDMLPPHQHGYNSLQGPEHRAFADRTLRELGEYLRRLEADLKHNLQGLKRDIKTHFSAL